MPPNVGAKPGLTWEAKGDSVAERTWQPTLLSRSLKMKVGFDRRNLKWAHISTRLFPAHPSPPARPILCGPRGPVPHLLRYEDDGIKVNNNTLVCHLHQVETTGLATCMNAKLERQNQYPILTGLAAAIAIATVEESREN